MCVRSLFFFHSQHRSCIFAACRWINVDMHNLLELARSTDSAKYCPRGFYYFIKLHLKMFLY
jgi:hypothetical protein